MVLSSVSEKEVAAVVVEGWLWPLVPLVLVLVVEGWDGWVAWSAVAAEAAVESAMGSDGSGRSAEREIWLVVLTGVFNEDIESAGVSRRRTKDERSSDKENGKNPRLEGETGNETGREGGQKRTSLLFLHQ